MDKRSPGPLPEERRQQALSGQYPCRTPIDETLGGGAALACDSQRKFSRSAMLVEGATVTPKAVAKQQEAEVGTLAVLVAEIHPSRQST